MSDSVRPHGLQHARSPCPAPAPRVLKLISVQSVVPSNPLILCCPLSLLPSIFPSIRVFSNESVLHIRWPKYWHFSFSISPSNEYSGPISFRMDSFESFKIPLGLISFQFKELSRIFSNTIVQKHQFFGSQLYGSTLPGKTIALTRWTFVGKVMSLLFNMLPRLAMTFLPRSKHLLILWLQSPSEAILEPKK